MTHPNQPSRKGKEVVHEHQASKQSRDSYVSRPPTGFSIHEPSNTSVISSSDEEEGHTEFHTPYTTDFQSNLTNTMILRGEDSNGSKHVNDVMGNSTTVMVGQVGCTLAEGIGVEAGVEVDGAEGIGVEAAACVEWPARREAR